MVEGKTWCGFPRIRVACCGITTIIVAAVVIAISIVGSRTPDNIEAIEISDSATPTSELEIQRQAVFDSQYVNGTLSILRSYADNTSYVALNDFNISAPNCDEAEVRLFSSGASVSSTGR